VGKGKTSEFSLFSREMRPAEENIHTVAVEQKLQQAKNHD